MSDYIEFAEPTRTTSIPKGKIKLSTSSKKDRKTGPIKAERIVIKNPITKMNTHS